MGAIEIGRPSQERSYDNLVLAERVLAVLEAANRLPAITVQGISNECQIPPSSVVRLLETLCANGFLIKLSRRGGYALTSKVKTLSAGFHGSPMVVEVLQSFADALTREFLWPFSVATLEYDAMVVQYSSIPLSPMAHVRTTLHKRLSLISRAHGLAYLASCSSSERHRLARIAVSSHQPEDKVVGSGRDWRRLIKQTRLRGYAVRASAMDPFTCSIAVPIVLEPNRVVATLGMTYFRNVVREPQIIAYATSLKAAAESGAVRIRSEIAERSHEPHHQFGIG